MRFVMPLVALDQQHLVAVVKQFAGYRSADRASTGDADAHRRPILSIQRFLSTLRSPLSPEHKVILTHNMSLQQLYLVLLAGGVVLLASIVATRLGTRIGLPSLLLFLGVGVIVGEDGLGLHFDNYLLADHLGTVALAIILIEGGLTTKFADVRRVLAPAGALATAGIAVSMAVTA